MDEEQRKQLDNLKKWSTSKWLVDHAKEAGIDIEGFEHQITNQFVDHVLNKHGNPEKEKLNGQIAIIDDDFNKIPDIVKSPDRAMIGAKRDGKDVLYYTKKMDNGTPIYMEKIVNDDGKRGLYGSTMFKKRKDVDENKFKNIVSMNKKTDISNAKIVNPIGNGSNPIGTKTVANPVKPIGQLSNTNIPQIPPDVKGKNIDKE